MNLTLMILLIYLALMFLIAWYFSRRESLESYFVNSKKTGLWLLTFASFATMIGAGSTVAIVSETYSTGIAYGITFPIAVIIGSVMLAILAKKIKKVSDEYNIYTLPEYFGKKYDQKNKILSLIVQIFSIIAVLGTQAIAMASLASVLIGVNFKLAILLGAAVTILYTTIGGLKIDFISDFIQFWIILFTFVVLGVISYIKIENLPNLFSKLPEGHLGLFNFAGPAWFFATIFFGGLLYLGTSTWQRIASSKNQSVARNSFILVIPLFIIFSLLLVLIGLAARIILPDLGQTDLVLFSMMEAVLPPYLVGVGFAAILAVLMSSIDSELIAGSTIIYKTLNKKSHFSTKKDLFKARLITALFGIAGFALAFIVKNIVSMALFAAYITITAALPLVASLYSNKISSNAIFYSTLIPIISLFISYPFIGPNSFVFPLTISIVLLIFYDKVFKLKSHNASEIIPY